VSRSARALRRLTRHAADLLAAAPPIAPTTYSEAPRYARTVAAQELAIGLLRYIAEVIVDETPETPPAVLGAGEDIEPAGVWIAAHDDRSACWISRSEAQAQRIAGRSPTTHVRFVPWGAEVWEA